MASKTEKMFGNVRGGTKAKPEVEGKAKGIDKLSGFADLDSIKPRPHGDARKPSLAAVMQIAESMCELGQITAVTTDRDLHLLAGGTRLEAIKFIREASQMGDIEQAIDAVKQDFHPDDLSDDRKQRINHLTALERLDPEAWGKHFSQGVKVSAYDFSAVENPALALAIETAENSKRKGFTRDEIEELVNRLAESDYKPSIGRNRKGRKDSNPVKAIAKLTGKSERTIQRMLNEANRKKLDVTELEPAPKAVKISTLEKRAAAALDELMEHPEFEKAFKKQQRNYIERTLEILQASA